MSQPKIPDNNLPVYLQQYEVNILNTDKLRPCNDKSCVSSERGCCPDNVTPVPPSGECEIGGCAGTEFGCCPYSTEAKADAQGSNCGTIAGSVLYTTVGAIPSNEIEKRVWQLDLSGSLKPGVEKYYIVYDFKNVNYKYKDGITFENPVSGTFTICGRVLDASKYLDYTFCDETLTLTIILDTKKWDFRLKKEVTFSYSINVDDDSCPNPSCILGGLSISTNDTKNVKIDYVFLQFKYVENTSSTGGTGLTIKQCSACNSDCNKTVVKDSDTLKIGTPNVIETTCDQGTCIFNLKLSYPSDTKDTLHFCFPVVD